MCSPATPSIWRLAIHPTAKLVLLALDHFSSPTDAGLCVQSQEALASACGLRSRQLRNLLGDLALNNHIEIVKRRDEKGRSLQNGYRLLVTEEAYSATGNGVPLDDSSHRQWSATRAAMECHPTGSSIHKEIEGGDKPIHIWIEETGQPPAMECLWTEEPPAMGCLWPETDPEYFYGEVSNLTSTGNGVPMGPPAMECRPSLSLKEVREVTATSLRENKKKGDRESGVCDSVGPRQKPRVPSATLSNPPGFDWRGIAEEIRPDLHQLDHVWAKFTVYQQGKCVSVFQHEKNWRLWLMRERKDSAPRPERPAVRHAPGAFIASLPRQPIHGHCEVIHEHV